MAVRMRHIWESHTYSCDMIVLKEIHLIDSLYVAWEKVSCGIEAYSLYNS